ncbi:MAG: hypothetical protein OXC62_00605 [Aestuariivita sp.]|nr:hypothetical protein [Aestuariivita sp.]
MTDVIGPLIRFVVFSGPSHDLTAMPDLFQDFSFEMLIDYKAVDSDALLDTLAECGVEVMISPTKNRTI